MSRSVHALSYLPVIHGAELLERNDKVGYEHWWWQPVCGYSTWHAYPTAVQQLRGRPT